MKTKKNTFVSNVICHDLDFQEELNGLLQKKDWVAISVLVNQMYQNKDKFEVSSKGFLVFNQQNCLVQSINQIIEDLTAKFKNQFEYILGSDFRTINDFGKVSHEISHIYFTPDEKVKKNIKIQVRNSLMITKSIMSNTRIKKTMNIDEDIEEDEEKFEEKSNISDLEDIEIDSVEEQIPQKKETKLINNNMFSSSLNPRLFD